MPFRSRSIAREVSSAVAVLATYVLVLLAPWHQAAGLQHDLAELGYSSPSTWSICAAASPNNGGDDTSAKVMCPAAGIGKQEFVATEPGSVDIAIMDLRGTPKDAQSVAVTISSPSFGIEPIKRDAIQSDNGWVVEGLTIPVAGAWQIELEVRVSRFELARLQAEIAIP